MKKENKWFKKEWIFFALLFVFSVLFSLWVHQGKGILNWESEIFADKSGYYIYLPATFLYQFDTKNAPQDIDKILGYGFVVDRQNNAIHTQFFYGVSLLISPFFLIAHGVSKIAGIDEYGGFSTIFNKMTDVAAIFYLVLGLFFLKKFLRNYFKENMQYFIIMVIYLGTNLFFYSIQDVLMSHVYSFFGVSFFLFSMKEFLKDNTRYKYFILMCIAYGLLISIRSTNFLIAAVFPFLDAKNYKEIISRILLIIRPKYIFPLIAITFVIFLPQILYWKLVPGAYNYIQQKYVAGYSTWKNPKMLEVWFSTLNGLVPWSPVNLIIMFSMIFMVFKRKANSLLILFFFIGISYMAAAYRFWHYGCAYGHRAFVEFFPLFCIPFGYFSEIIFESSKKLIKVFYVILILFMLYMNTGLSIYADKFFWGSTWDWGQYSRQIKRIHLYPKKTSPVTFKNDFENGILCNGNKMTDSIHYSGLWCVKLDKVTEYCCEHSKMIWEFGFYPQKIIVKLKAKMVPNETLNAGVVCSFELEDSLVNYQFKPLNEFTEISQEWFSTINVFKIPQGLSGDTKVRIYIWNIKKEHFFVDDIEVKYE